MIERAESPSHILHCLDNLKSNNRIDDSKFLQLKNHVEVITKLVSDAGKLDLPDNQLPVSSIWRTPANVSNKTTLIKTLKNLEERFNSLYDPDSKDYKKWDEFTDTPRQRPSQATTFEQLKFRFKQKQPIIAAIVAPAGFGKSELLHAWLHYTAVGGLSLIHI